MAKRRIKGIATFYLACLVAIGSGCASELSSGRYLTSKYDASTNASRLDLDESVFRYDRSAPTDIVIVDSLERSGIIVVDFSYASPMQGRVPAYLLLPSEPTAPTPAIFLLHGLPGNRESLIELGIAYAKEGIYVLAISAPFSRVDLPYREPVLFPAPRFDQWDRVEMEQIVQDVGRGIDLLTTNPNIDADRISFVGFSYGGGIGALLAAVEPRFNSIALMSPTGGIASFVRHIDPDHPVRLAFDQLDASSRTKWFDQMDPVEPVLWLGNKGTSKPLLIQAALDDEAVKRSDTIGLLNSAPSGTEVQWYKSGHTLPPQAMKRQADFLSKHWGVPLDGFKPPKLRN